MFPPELCQLRTEHLLACGNTEAPYLAFFCKLPSSPDVNERPYDVASLSCLFVRKFSQEKSLTMKKIALGVAITLCLCSLLAAQDSSSQSDHFEGGVFADYFNLSRTNPHINFVGVAPEPPST